MKPPHLDENWLRARYVNDGLSTYDIGKLVGRDPKRIYEKLVDFGIPTRPRGLNLKGADNYNNQPDAVPTFAGKKHSDEARLKISASAARPRPHLRGKANGMYGKTGALNPRYRDGSSPERQRVYASAEWKSVAQEVRRRDGFKCVRCGAAKQGRRSLHLHHIAPWAEAPEMRFAVDNIVTVCKGCHDWIHSADNTHRQFLA